MDPINSNPSPSPLPQLPERPYTDVPGFTSDKNIKPAKHLPAYLPLLILLALLPLVTGAALLRQYFSSQAANSTVACSQKISTVRINPGKISAYLNNPPIPMSALAYDSLGRPIWKDVVYEWGMSSSNTIGNIIPKGQIAAFKPLNAGTGNIYTTGFYCGQQAKGSIPVIISPALPTPTPRIPCLPRPKCLDLKPACKIVQPARGWCQ